MTFFALYGDENCGKTQTLKTIALLQKDYPTFKPIIVSDILFDPNDDIIFFCEIRGKIIGVITLGDPYYGLYEQLCDLVNKHNCDFISCASRDYGVTTNNIKDIVLSGKHQVFWTPTQQIENGNKEQCFTANNQKANELLGLFKFLADI